MVCGCPLSALDVGVKVAVVDLGTNTCRLLLADADGERVVRVQRRETAIVRLGQGVDEHRRLHPAAVRRTLDQLSRYTQLIDEYRPLRSLLVATSGLRDARDGEAFLRRVEERFDLPSRIITGEEEGRLTFRGAVAGAPGLGQAPVVVIDIGGGSTEVAVGRREGRNDADPAFVASVGIGAVRLTERLLVSDPPTREQVMKADAVVRRTLEEAVPDRWRREVRTGLGVAGTITSLVMYGRGMHEYRLDLVHGAFLAVTAVDEAIEAFARMTNRERRGLPGIEPGRHDVILAGALIARRACDIFGLPGLTCVEADLLEGAALELAGSV